MAGMKCFVARADVDAMAREAVDRISWLCETPADRERVVDMEQRLKPLRATSFAVLAVALLASGPWVGWWTIVPLAAAGLAFPVSHPQEVAFPPALLLAVALLSMALMRSDLQYRSASVALADDALYEAKDAGRDRV
jgi:hypothetical protein